MVDWLVYNGLSGTREDATILGEKLVKCGLIMCCVSTTFKDDVLFYRYSKHDEKIQAEKRAKKPKKTKPVSKFSKSRSSQLISTENRRRLSPSGILSNSDKKVTIPELTTPFRAMVQTSTGGTAKTTSTVTFDKKTKPAAKAEKTPKTRRKKSKSVILTTAGVPRALVSKVQLERRRKLQKELTKRAKKREKEFKEQENKLLQLLNTILLKGQQFKEPPLFVGQRYLPIPPVLPESTL